MLGYDRRSMVQALAKHSRLLRRAGVDSIRCSLDTGWSNSLVFIVAAASNHVVMCGAHVYDKALGRFVERPEIPKVRHSRVAEGPAEAIRDAMSAEGIGEATFRSFEFRTPETDPNGRHALVWPPSLLQAEIEGRLRILQREAADMAELAGQEAGC